MKTIFETFLSWNALQDNDEISSLYIVIIKNALQVVTSENFT